MKLSVEFPSVSYREGPAAVASLARAIERIGYDHIDIFDHVIMGVPIEGRPRGPYNAAMPILEALMALSYIAAVTTRVTLGTEVLVLPQRQPTLVAKQALGVVAVGADHPELVGEHPDAGKALEPVLAQHVEGARRGVLVADRLHDHRRVRR